MYVQTDKNKYHVGFKLDRETGSRAITRCKIFLLEPDNSPTLVGRGRTLQGKKDVFNSVTGCTYALKRALEDSCLQRPARILFWKEFNRCHRRDIVTCRKAFANIGSNFSEALHKLINVSKAFEDDARRVCAHRIVSKGSGLDWCAKHRVDCTPKVQCGVTSAESTPGYGGLHSFQKRAMKKMLALGNPTGRGQKSLYAHYRHEYHDNPA